MDQGQSKTAAQKVSSHTSTYSGTGLETLICYVDHEQGWETADGSVTLSSDEGLTQQALDTGTKLMVCWIIWLKT